MQEWPALRMRSLYSSQAWTSSVNSTPTWSHSGLPVTKASSSTHWRNGSATTGQRSTMPSRASRAARSSSEVTGVIRSTIEFGKLQCESIHVASPSATPSAAESRARRAASPLPGRLSQLRIVTAADAGSPPLLEGTGEEVERRVGARRPAHSRPRSRSSTRSPRSDRRVGRRRPRAALRCGGSRRCCRRSTWSARRRPSRRASRDSPGDGGRRPCRRHQAAGRARGCPSRCRPGRARGCRRRGGRGGSPRRRCGRCAGRDATGRTSARERRGRRWRRGWRR